MEKINKKMKEMNCCSQSPQKMKKIIKKNCCSQSPHEMNNFEWESKQTIFFTQNEQK